MTTVTVPTKRRREAFVPAAGTYTATIATVGTDGAGSGFEIRWRFSARGATAPPDARKRQTTLPQELSADELGDVLHDLGLAGQDVELEDLAGRQAKIEVKTFGGKKSARVVGVAAIG